MSRPRPAAELLESSPHRSRRFWGRYSYLSLARALDQLAARHLASERPGLLVDYGCGEMPFRRLFAGYVERYEGADLPENQRADVQLREGALPHANGSADVVLSSQVLEHVDDPAAYLGEAFRVLRPGGLLLLSTHGHWPYHPHPTDHWRWTHTGLTKVVTASGFELLEIRGSMNLLQTGIQFVQDALRRKLPRTVTLPIVLLTQNVVLPALAGRGGRSPLDAAVLIVVGRRVVGDSDRFGTGQ